MSNREMIMLQLFITEEDLLGWHRSNKPVEVMEKLFYAALCSQTTEVVRSVVDRYNEMYYMIKGGRMG